LGVGLREWFGPSRAEIWRQLSDKVGGRYVERGFWKGDCVEAAHKDWIVTLDVIVVPAGKVQIPMTRLRAPYVNPTRFRFDVYREGVFSGIAKAFGMQDIEVGDADFDERFIVKGTDESQVKALLANPRVRELIEGQPDIRFGVRDDDGWFSTRFPEDVDQLHFEVSGDIKDVERLSLLYELFAETLDQLTRIGAAYAAPPQVRL
jgi:hypothetical protein